MHFREERPKETLHLPLDYISSFDMEDHVKRQIFLIHSEPCKSRLAFHLINIFHSNPRSATATNDSQEQNTTAPIRCTRTCTAKYDGDSAVCLVLRCFCVALRCVAYHSELWPDRSIVSHANAKPAARLHLRKEQSQRREHAQHT